MPRELRQSIDRQSFSAQLSAARAASGLSLRALAERTRGTTRRRIHYTRLCLLERGLEPRDDEVRTLAAALGAAVTERLAEFGGARHAA